MDTTTRLRPSAKARLRRIQDVWTRQAGRRVSQVELLDLGIAYLDRHAEAFAKEMGRQPWTPEKIKGFLARLPTSTATGSWTDDIDDVVYGDPSGEHRNARRP